jgi:hypothetical protein
MRDDNLNFLLFAVIIFALIAFFFSYFIIKNTVSKNDLDSETETQDSTAVTQIPAQQVLENNNPNTLYDVAAGDTKITVFGTDKKSYSSREKIFFSVNIVAERDVENAQVKVSGIKPYQTPYINEIRPVNLKKGENKIIVEAIAPSCTTGCGGIYPGAYDVIAELFVENILIDRSTSSINLVEN